MFGNQSSFWESTRLLDYVFPRKKKVCSEIKVVKKKTQRSLSCVERFGKVWVEAGCESGGSVLGLECPWALLSPTLQPPRGNSSGELLTLYPQLELLLWEFPKEQFPFPTLGVIADTRWTERAVEQQNFSFPACRRLRLSPAFSELCFSTATPRCKREE